MSRLVADNGFSLLEVLVATLILALTFSAVFPIFGSAPQRIADTKAIAFAARLATTQLEQEVLRTAWDQMPIQGGKDGWAWEISGQPYDEEQALDGGGYPLILTANVWKSEDPDRVLASLQRIVWVTE